MTKEQPTQAEKDRIKAMLSRMLQAYDVDKPTLSQILGCQINTMNNWAHYGRVPYEQLEKCRAATGVTMDWLLYGEQLPKPLISNDVVEELSVLLRDVIEGAADYGSIALQIPDAAENMIGKLQKELRKRYNIDVAQNQD